MSEIKVIRPDILDCLANLSSDEVFTPPSVVNEMLDQLPQELFSNPKTRFLDPFTKSGVFLREIVKRLDKGLEKVIPDKEERIRHIFMRQVYGIAITRLTALFSRRSLYCNKDVNNERSVIRDCFKTDAGNIGYHPCKHKWVDGSCTICGASKKPLSNPDAENYAYPFLHDEVFMKQAQELGFDVVIGNPPYHMEDGGNAASAASIYHLFVNQALKLNPRFLSMIIPARWYANGKGKGVEEFRRNMLKSGKISLLVDYKNSSDCFPGVNIAGGVCYFLWERDHNGDCTVVNANGSGNLSNRVTRSMSDYPVFVRDNVAINIIKKVFSKDAYSLSKHVLSYNYFSIRSYERGSASKCAKAVTLLSSAGKGYYPASNVDDRNAILNKYKVIITYAMSGGNKPSSTGDYQVVSSLQILEPGEVCTETYLVLSVFDKKNLAENFCGYVRTRLFRFLLLQALTSIHITKESFCFVPCLNFAKSWTDASLYDLYGLTTEETNFIESIIRPMDEEEK